MSAIDDGGPAFPTAKSFLERQRRSEDHRFTHDIETVGGMSLRDWFAGQAMHAVLRNAGRHFHSTEDECTACRAQTARIAYAHADAMLAARSKSGGEQS